MIAADGWHDAVDDALRSGFDHLDWLGATDDGPERATLTVVLHLWSTLRREQGWLRTELPRDEAAVASVVDVYGGASWYEREAAEMFGITFVGSPDSRPLLLRPGMPEAPLRKDVALPARDERRWPGASGPTPAGRR